MSSTGKASSRRSDALSPAERMKASALRMLSLRSHTRAELRRKLRGRGHGGEEVEALLDRLAEIGYLDDEAAVRSWVRRRLESRPMGRRLMEEELKGRGVSRSLLAAALDEAYGEGAEPELARRAARKRLGALGGGSSPRARERLLRFLRGRGFPARVCLQVADALCGGRPEEAGWAGAAPFDSSGE